MKIATVNGWVDSSELGKTLMHEHLLIGLPGWEFDAAVPRATLRELAAICIDKIEELKAAGYRTLIDPCPNDLGRDVGLMVEVANRTGFNIICASGFYNEGLGGNAYWRFRSISDPDFVDYVADLIIRELTEGIGDTGVRAGIIKLGTADPPMTEYEMKIFAAGAKASLATGVPITTHTDAVLGDVQLRRLVEHGVPAHRIVIGHSCGTADHAYHRALLDGGAYLGFDRFGMELLRPDDDRVSSLMKVVKAGGLRQIVVSHDSVWCFRGNPIPNSPPGRTADTPLRFERIIVPKLKAAGLSREDIEVLQVHNPRRYFEGVIPHQREQRAGGNQ